MKDHYGMSLITLLISIAGGILVFLLILMVWSQWNGSKRDQERVDDMAMMQDALDRYREELGATPCGTNKPALPVGWFSDSTHPQFLDGSDDALDECPDGYRVAGTNKGIVQAGYLDKTPDDPVSDRKHWYWYFTDSSQESYVLIANLDRDEERERNDNGLCRNLYEVGDVDWWLTDPFENLIVAGDSPCCFLDDSCQQQ